MIYRIRQYIRDVLQGVIWMRPLPSRIQPGWDNRVLYNYHEPIIPKQFKAPASEPVIMKDNRKMEVHIKWMNS